MKCQSRFRRIRPLVHRMEEAAYSGMEQIEPATNVRVLEVGGDDEWVRVEYDWPDDGPKFDTTDDVMRPFGLELVKGWRELKDEPLG